MRCKNCHYSLEGLTERRCPECGSAFDIPRPPVRPRIWLGLVALTLIALPSAVLALLLPQSPNTVTVLEGLTAALAFGTIIGAIIVIPIWGAWFLMWLYARFLGR